LAPAVQWLMTMVTHIPVDASETVQELCGCASGRAKRGSDGWHGAIINMVLMETYGDLMRFIMIYHDLS